MTHRDIPLHAHRCGVCGLGSAWCCRHRWTIGYIAVVTTILLCLTLAGF